MSSSCGNGLAVKGIDPPLPAVQEAIATLRAFYYGGAGANVGADKNDNGTVTLSFYDEGERLGARLLFAVTYTPEGKELEKHRRDLKERLAWQAAQAAAEKGKGEGEKKE